MRREKMRLRVTALCVLTCLSACGNDTNKSLPEPTLKREVSKPFAVLADDAPAIEKRPVALEQHGKSRIDNYAWLRDDNWQEVLRDPGVLREDIHDQLTAENDYYESATGNLEALRKTLYDEMRGRVKEDDSSVPAVDGPYAYAVRYREGGEYPIYVRTARDGGDETILFDGDAESEGEEFFRVASVSHSPNHQMIAYSVDRLGSEYYDIRVRIIDSGEEFAETIPSTSGSPVWAADSKSIYYIERDDNQRPKRVKQHVLGTDPGEDLEIYEEADDTMFLAAGKSQSGKFIFIASSKGTTSEYRYLHADAEPGSEPVLIAPRVDNQLYDVEHHGDHFYIRTNADDAVDFKIVRSPVENPGRDHWQDWLEHRQGTYLVGFVPFEERLVVLERENALPRIVVATYDREDVYEIDFDEDAYSLGLVDGYEFDTEILRYSYESPSTPEQIFDFDMNTREREVRKTQVIPSGHNPDNYVVERLFVTAQDGAEIPVTVLRLASTRIDGTAPLLLYGYGSYGITIQAGFGSNVLSLVDRGVVYATAHVRGGAAKGRQWYLDGKLDKKMNTFTDFAEVAEELQNRGYGSKGETVIYGGSAGGLLVGATVNLRPDLFSGVIAAVPFVDVLNTISDASLPLTPPEWVEWGDPINDQAAFESIAAYSPYENVQPGVDYPPILATAGLTDYRVTYWEPAKWVAQLRTEAEGGPFFMKTNMGAGHSGSAARFERLRERAHDYSFALKIFGLTEAVPISHQ